MTGQDWARYFSKSGDTKLHIDGVEYIENEHGFATFYIDETADAFVISQLYGAGRGDGQYWHDFLTSLARKLRCKKMVFATKRNAKAFERKFGFKPIATILEKEL